VATILIHEPHPEVRDLLERIVHRLGHDAQIDRAAVDPDAVHADVLLLEPAGRAALERAQALAEATGAPLVCVSIYPPSDEVLALRPAAYLMKPFSLIELERALLAALERVEPAAAT
jgi:DNA-binding response OmpR family regulator